VKIAVLIEGRTEQAYKTHLLEFLKRKLDRRMPKVDFFPCRGRIYKGEKLRRTVEDLLRNGRSPSDAVIALTDVYTGTNDFVDAADAKRKMVAWSGTTADSTRMPHSLILKLGYFHFGATFRRLPATTKARRLVRRKP
jgi:hypothetical protein